ncbi:MAG: ABC transporter substrate-binding protein [Firmicutes bacterium HGW-Firmicutes-12]|nr:MAG: ABC transporter substrate-binding protein [Firmicutes bacterium HGW-Firmicutes-12]
MNVLKNNRALLVLLVFLLAVCLLVVGCQKDTNTSDGETKKKEIITIAESTWDSAMVNSEIAKYILENGYDYNVELISASSMIELQSHAQGEIDVRIENWTKTYGDEYYKPLEEGSIVEINEILTGNEQALYVPTYIIKGDPARGIEPVAPDLKSVFDLPKYWELFKDPEDSSKGRIIGAPNTWSTNQQLEPKMVNYELDKNYNLFFPGSGTALSTSIASAYEKGEPVIAYYWGPTWILGKYDLTALEEPEYTDEAWEDYNCEWPPDVVSITVYKDLIDQAPDVVEFFKKFEMSSAKMNEILAYVNTENADPHEAAIWYLENNENIWSNWMPQEISEKVNTTLQ